MNIPLRILLRQLFIHKINTHYFDQGYVFVSFDAESSFTNMPLKKTDDLI